MTDELVRLRKETFVISLVQSHVTGPLGQLFSLSPCSQISLSLNTCQSKCYRHIAFWMLSLRDIPDQYRTQHKHNRLTHLATCRPVCESYPEPGPAPAPSQGLPDHVSSKCPLLKMVSRRSVNCYTGSLPTVPLSICKLSISVLSHEISPKNVKFLFQSMKAFTLLAWLWDSCSLISFRHP
jgi:hypothetical protein